MKLSIVIVNWRSRDYVRRCLVSLRATCESLRPEIIVVDGGSFDGCGEMLAVDFPEVIFIQSRENIGFGRCNNLGFERATGDLLLLLNPDTETQPGAVGRLVETLLSLPDAGIVGAGLLNPDGSRQLSGVHRLPTPWNAAFDTDAGRLRWWRRRGLIEAAQPMAVEAISGACMLMRAEVFRRAGGFTPDYFMYAEDMDLCFKVRSLGLRMWYEPRARILHHGGGSSGAEVGTFAAVMMPEALHLYFLRNHGAAAAACFRLLQGFSAGLRLAILAPASLLCPPPSRTALRRAVARWRPVLRWSLGLESWASRRQQQCA